MTFSEFASASSATTPTQRGVWHRPSTADANASKTLPFMSDAQARRMPGRRELVFPLVPCIAVYSVTDNAVEVSRIFHGAQDWP